MPKNVLVIDGDLPFANTMVARLQARGLSARVCSDGAQALERVRTERPDLIVLAVELPTASGYSICNKLKKDEQLRSIPVVLTSADATPQTFEQHRKLRTHADEYLLKPFEPARLLDTIGCLVELSPEPAHPVVAPEPAQDDDALLIDRAFDQLATEPVDTAAGSVPTAGGFTCVSAPPATRGSEGDGTEIERLRTRIAELEARAAETERRLAQYEADREALRRALADALRLVRDAPV